MMSPQPGDSDSLCLGRPIDFRTMRALLSGMIAAIEAAAVALATLLVITLFAVLVWWISFGLGAEPGEVMGVAASVWLFAHGVPLAFELSAETMQLFGFDPSALAFGISLTPLGLTLITVVYAVRSGWRFANRGGSGAAGVLGGAVGFGAAAWALAVFGPLLGTTLTDVSPIVSALIPALVYGVASGLAFLLRAAREEQDWWLKFGEIARTGLSQMGLPKPARLQRGLASALRLAMMLIAAYIGLAGVGIAAAIVVGYTNVIAASQSLQLDLWGVLMMFVLQLAYLPTFVVWAGSWLSGAGFAVGLGSSASPFGALLGPMPGFPVLAAIPDGWGQVGALAPMLIALLGLACGAALGGTARRHSAFGLVGVVVTAAAFAGLAIALLGWMASGSLGPGRLATVGVGVWISGGLAAAELGVGAMLGVFAARADLARRAVAAPAEVFRRFTGESEDVATIRETDSIGSSDSRSHTAEPVTPESIAPAISIVERLEQRADSDDDLPTLPIEGEVPDEWPTDEWGTEETPESAQHEPAHHEPDPPRREPELFDQSSGGEQADPPPRGTPAPDSIVDPLDGDPLDPDALERAYSWDNVDAAAQQEDTKPGWRFGRRKR